MQLRKQFVSKHVRNRKFAASSLKQFCADSFDTYLISLIRRSPEVKVAGDECTEYCPSQSA